MPKLSYRRTVLTPKVRVRTINPATGRLVYLRKPVPGSVLASDPDPQPAPIPAVSQVQSTGDPKLTPSAESVTENCDTRYWRKKKSRIESWQKIRHSLLQIHTELFAPSSMRCKFCPPEIGDLIKPIRCLDCGPHAQFCEDHYMQHHMWSPFHSPHIWNGHCFVVYEPPRPTVLREDHKDFSCDRKERSIFVIGMQGRPQRVTFEFCSCEAEAATWLRHRLWAASPEAPTMAFSLNLMEWLRALTLECQVSVKGFVDAIAAKLEKMEALTLNKVCSLYQGLIRDSVSIYMHHYYQLSHLQHLDKDLDDGTKCPVCDVSAETSSTSNASEAAVCPKKAVLQCFSFDANFGLVRKKSSGKSPVEQFHKEHYFLDQADVDMFITTYPAHCKAGSGDCSNFQAGNNTRSKARTDKLDETAVFGSACSRHEFPHTFISLKHGERLGYAVYLLKNLLERTTQPVTIMYDIACVLAAHMKKNNCDMGAQVKYVLPIFHSFGHKMSCQLDYGPRSASGIGLTDGETMERLWSYLRKFSTITKQMTSQRRVDLLTDALLHYSAKLRQKLGKHFVQKMKNMEATVNECEEQMQKLMVSINGHLDRETLAKWRSDEKTACSSADGPSTSKGKYVMTLFDLYHKQSVHVPSEESEDRNTEVAVLEAKVARLEIQHGFTRLPEDSIEYKNLLAAAVTDRRKALLEQLRGVSAERIYNLTQLSEARGQDMAKKLSGVVSRLNRKLKTILNVYNKYECIPGSATLPSVLHFAEVAERGSQLFSVVPETSALRRRVIQTLDTYSRCKEEEHLLKKEVASAHSWFFTKYKACQALRDRLQSSTLFDAGSRALLVQHMYQYEVFMQDMETVHFAELDSVPKPIMETVIVSGNDVPGDTDPDDLTDLEKQEIVSMLQQGYEGVDVGDDELEDDGPEDECLEC